MGDRLHGRVTGLAASDLRALEHLYRRRPEPELCVTTELARELGTIANRIGRMVGVVLDRRGRLVDVAVGDALEVAYPAASVADSARDRRLVGLRFVRTKPENVAIAPGERLVLTQHRLDALVLVGVDRGGIVRSIRLGMILPPGEGEPIEWTSYPPTAIEPDFLERVEAREEEIARKSPGARRVESLERAILLGLTTGPPAPARESLAELAELARSCGISVVERMLQRRERVNPSTLFGAGFLEEAVHRAAVSGAGRLVVDGELTPMQARNLEQRTGLAVMDRTMLILEIFGRRAVTADGKLRVDLARLQYLGPHLTGKGIDLSRLGGGKGRSRGAGEMKLEMDRRQLRDDIVKLKRRLAEIGGRRAEQRKRRGRSSLPQVALVGY
ncbi:MAG TPA: GTPase HflX, partial [Planctomycetota bacterium]|nr:GTPase HflX [Planctomycetota bacterium]